MTTEPKKKIRIGDLLVQNDVITEQQLMTAAAELERIILEDGDPGVILELMLFPPPPASAGGGQLTKEWADAAAVVETWLCNRFWATNGRARVTPSDNLLAGVCKEAALAPAAVSAKYVYMYVCVLVYIYVYVHL